MSTSEGITLDNYDTNYQFIRPFGPKLSQQTHNKWQFWTFKRSNNKFHNYFRIVLDPHRNN